MIKFIKNHMCFKQRLWNLVNIQSEENIGSEFWAVVYKFIGVTTKRIMNDDIFNKIVA